ncbi:hypothetical protein SNE40_021501 [Patella caerulea]|uniref:Uncharacterized protein n=1 Tax=Patella caerulea TaxID=87958 RepID=A0AAN8G7W1_PATCE
MATPLRIQELIRHIGDVYPQKVVNHKNKLDPLYDNHRPGVSNMASIGGSHVKSLDLVDIRKEQRRLAALLEIKTRDPLFAVPKYRPAPKRRCIICNLPNADRRLFNGPLSYTHRGMVIPRVPEPSFVDECGHGCSDDDEVRFINDLRTVGDGTFKLPSLEAQALAEKHSKDFRRDRFKLPPVFDKDNSTTTDKGRLLALTSDRTFMDTSVGNENYLDLTPRQTSQSLILSRISEASALGTEDESRIDHHRFRDVYSTMNKLHRRNSRNDRSQPEWSEFSTDQADIGILRYHHRQDSDIIPVPQNSPEKFYDEFKENSMKYRYQLSSASDKSSSKRPSREQSFDFVREDVSSSFSRETTFGESPSNFMSRLQSASWCECSNVDISRLRCSECLKIGGHQRWCVSKLGVCPQCGKAVKSTMSIIGEGRLSRSPSFTLMKGGRGKSSTISANYERNALSSLKPQSSELKVRFSDTDEVRSISPMDAMSISDQFVDERYDEVAISGAETKVVKRFNDVLLENKPQKVFKKSLFDADIHKAAYELALSDSRVMKYKKDKNLSRSLNNSLSGTLFSYFPKLRYPASRSVAADTIGLRDPDENKRSKVKVKKAMKHIFGKVKVDDYYPKTKDSKTKKLK